MYQYSLKFFFSERSAVSPVYLGFFCVLLVFAGCVSELDSQSDGMQSLEQTNIVLVPEFLQKKEAIQHSEKALCQSSNFDVRLPFWMDSGLMITKLYSLCKVSSKETGYLKTTRWAAMFIPCLHSGGSVHYKRGKFSLKVTELDFLSVCSI